MMYETYCNEPYIFFKKMSKQLSATQRANILFARDHGDSYQTIANKVGCGKSTVRDVFRRLEATGTTSPGKRSGQPKILNEKSQASLRRLVTKDKNRRHSLSQIKTAWEKKSKTSLSHSMMPASALALPAKSPFSLKP